MTKLKNGNGKKNNKNNNDNKIFHKSVDTSARLQTCRSALFVHNK